MRRLPQRGHSRFTRRATSATRSGRRLTGRWAWTSSWPFTSMAFLQPETVDGDTTNALAVALIERPYLAACQRIRSKRAGNLPITHIFERWFGRPLVRPIHVVGALARPLSGCGAPSSEGHP